MVLPGVEGGLAEIGHNVFDRHIFKDRGLIEVKECFQEVIGQPSRASAQFYEVDWLAGIKRPRLAVGGNSGHIPQPAKDHLGIRLGDVGVAGDVVGDRAITPGVYALPVKEVALQGPKQRLRKALVVGYDVLIIGHHKLSD